MEKEIMAEENTAENDTESTSVYLTAESEEKVTTDKDRATNINSNDESIKEVKMPTKIVVRRLPPSMKEKEFLESVSPLPDHDHFDFFEADQTLIPYGLSRATINFINEEEVFSFKERFDGYVFIDTKGHEYSAIVEFAPNQKIPKKSRSRKDAKNGTINEDSDFLKFVEELQNPTKSTRTMQQCLEDIDAKEKELKSKEKMTPLLEYIKEKADKKRQDREQRRDSRRKREEERKKARDDERKRKKEKKEQEIREREIRDKDRKERPTNRSGSSRQHHKGIDAEKRNTDKFESSNKINKEELTNEGIDKSGRRGTKGTKNSSETTNNRRIASRNDKDRVEAEKPFAKGKENDMIVEQDESGKSSSKYGSKTRNKDDRRRIKEPPRDEKVVQSREERQRERDEREKERFRKREEERQKRWQQQKEERQRQKEAAEAATGSVEPENNECDSKTKDDRIENLEANPKISKDADNSVIINRNVSAEVSQNSHQKSSKRYSDRRRDDKTRKDLTYKKFEEKSETGQNVTLDEMTKDLSNILHLDNSEAHKEVQLGDKSIDGREKDKRRQNRGRDKDQGERDARESHEIEKRKSKQERPALQIYKPGMGRLNSQGIVKGNIPKSDEEKYKSSEPEIAKHQEEQNSSNFKQTNRQKDRDRNNRNYKSDPTTDKPDYKRYEKHQNRSGTAENDRDRKSAGQEKEQKEHVKSSTQEDSRKRHEGKFDYKNRPKDDRDTVRNDVQKGSIKSEGRNNSGKDRKDIGRYNDRPYPTNKYATKDDQSTSNKDGHTESIECTNTPTDSVSTSIEPTKEKERSGKSYSSKRKERQQQKNEQ